MKIHCRVCAVHFKKDFEETLKAPCNFWGDIGMGNVPPELKQKVWEWVFSMPCDEMAVTCNLNIAFTIGTIPLNPQDLFENRVIGYAEMTEEQKIEYQRNFFKEQQKKAIEAEQLKNQAQNNGGGEGSIVINSLVTHRKEDRVN